jgi:hypothetical protein
MDSLLCPKYFKGSPQVPSVNILRQDESIKFTIITVLSQHQAKMLVSAQLWTTLTDAADDKWAPLDFNDSTTTMKLDYPTQVYPGAVVKYYELTVDTNRHKPSHNFKQFTYRLMYKRNNTTEYWWAGKPGCNGIIRWSNFLQNQVPVSRLVEHICPDTKVVELPKVDRTYGYTWPIEKTQTLRYWLSDLHKFFAMVQKTESWFEPQNGDCTSCLEGRSIFQLVWQRKDGIYGLLFCQPSDDGCAFLSCDRFGNVIWGSKVGSARKSPVTAILLYSYDMYSLFRRSVETMAEHVDVAQVVNGIQPDNTYLLSHLGYCTWNAFYKDITKDKIINALQYLAKLELNVGYFLIDDGWQETSHDSRLCSFSPNSMKMGDTLNQLFLDMKKTLPSISHIGVWVALQGYWKG